MDSAGRRSGAANSGDRGSGAKVLKIMLGLHYVSKLIALSAMGLSDHIDVVLGK